MGGIKFLKTVPTIVLLRRLNEALECGQQSYVNIYAYELACRLYVPGSSTKDFLSLLKDFGYKTQSLDKDKILDLDKN